MAMMHFSAFRCRRAAALCLAALMAAIPLVPFSMEGGFWPVAVVHADDDDDDGGDDGNGGEDGNGGSGSLSSSGTNRGSSGRDPGARQGRNGSFLDLFRGPRREPRRRVVRRAPVERPAMAARELLALGLGPQAITQLAAEGFVRIDSVPIGLAGGDLVSLRIPEGLTLDAARAAVVRQAPDAITDFNHYYEPENAGTGQCAGAGCALVRDIVGWPDRQGLASCTAVGRIGLIDTAINPDHAALAGARIDIVRLGNGTLPPSGRQHGTAVAALLVGQPDSRAPGLLPGAELIAVDAFHRAGGSADRASVYDLLRALDLLAARDVTVINMSLSGPANRLLENVVAAALARGLVLVAAAGNDGPRAKPVYPAAYEGVIAVTAIDRSLKPYRRAVQGDHIDIAAPGVGVWTAASLQGGRPKSGTSFAAPFVAAAVALLKSKEPGLAPRAIAERLAQGADDLGEPGKDPVFGWGLLNARTLCGV